ncbi:DUF6766 family protein [Microbacterium sp. YY-01]|uniref:DUF6766 family protein n=1 Tax=Microbacterium sp. YY-01 TaxID=3421634 RepID=UPI003D168D8C
MKKGITRSALSIVFLVLFFGALIGQSFAGHAVTVAENLQHGEPAPGYWEYLWSSEFVVDVAENWQSEFLQFFVFIAATVWFVQQSSPESKAPRDEGTQSDRQQKVGRFADNDSPQWARSRGFRQWVYANSLLLVMGTLFMLSWLAQSVAGHIVMNSDRMQHGQSTLSWAQYLASPDFWDRTLQNWQSEFLAVGVMIAFAIYLRQRGSSESKPVGAPHYAQQ